MLVLRVKKRYTNKDLINVYGRERFETLSFKTMDQFYNHCKKINDNQHKYGYTITMENFKSSISPWIQNRKIK